jgi:hypothetical protein
MVVNIFVAVACMVGSGLVNDVSGAAREEAVSLKEVLHGVGDYLRSIQYVECTYKMTATSLGTPETPPVVRLYEYRSDIFGREYSSQTPWPRGSMPLDCDRYAWNGEIMKTYTSVGNGSQQGSVGIAPPGTLDCHNPIMASLDFINKRSTITSLYSTPSTLTGVERTGDDEIYAVRFERIAPMPSMPGGFYTTMWFSRKCGFAPTRRTDELNGKPLQEIIFEQQEVSPGIWLPMRMSGKGYSRLEGGSGRIGSARLEGTRLVTNAEPTGISIIEVEPGSYKLNIPDTKGKFDLTFPSGLLVIDTAVGATYVTGAIETWDGGVDQKSLDEAVASSKKVLAERPMDTDAEKSAEKSGSNNVGGDGAEKRPSLLTWLAFIGVSSVLVVTVIWAQRRKMHKKIVEGGK